MMILLLYSLNALQPHDLEPKGMGTKVENNIFTTFSILINI